VKELPLLIKEAPIAAVEGLAKAYTLRRGILGLGRELVHALAGVTFQVRRGETLGVVGESGSGKSTLGKVMLRLVEPSFGRILWSGVDVTRMKERELRKHRRKMQIVFQDPYSSLDPRMTVREIVGEGLQLFGMADRSALDDRVAGMLRRVGLDGSMMERYPHEFSGGQRQRIAIARALAVEPDFVVCDEPVSALDVSVQGQIVNLLEEIQEDSQVAYLFVSHDLRLVQCTAHRTAVMYLGRIVEIGPSARVAEHPLHPYTRALFASSPPYPTDKKRAKRALPLAGEPPSATNPPRGCAFHPRCDRAEKGVCDRDVPKLEPSPDDSSHRVACFHAFS
jgi:oligopeptide/dipeptide ABC transporter ATP-binding protein